ncbi:hypothetical protein ACFL2B_00815 [Patescibacteria group bacterium]
MTSEQGKGIPRDAAEWHPPKTEPATDEVPEKEDAKTDSAEVEKEVVGKETPPEETAVERVRPTRDNPIQEMRIGLQHTMGQADKPTRVVATLKDGAKLDIPWKQAEKLLPAEYKEARELGERARKLEREATRLATAIRAGTDVMKRSGHIKDGLLRIIGSKTKAYKYLQEADKLYDEISHIAQESFMELRRMTNTKESHAKEIDALTAKLDDCENSLQETYTNAFQDFPRAEAEYKKFAPKNLPKLKKSTDPNQPKLSNPEEPKT